jgi:hypothetical protein
MGEGEDICQRRPHTPPPPPPLPNPNLPSWRLVASRAQKCKEPVNTRTFAEVTFCRDCMYSLYTVS